MSTKKKTPKKKKTLPPLSGDDVARIGHTVFTLLELQFSQMHERQRTIMESLTEPSLNSVLQSLDSRITALGVQVAEAGARISMRLPAEKVSINSTNAPIHWTTNEWSKFMRDAEESRYLGNPSNGAAIKMRWFIPVLIPATNETFYIRCYRNYAYTVTKRPNGVKIVAGCNTWFTFGEAFRYYWTRGNQPGDPYFLPYLEIMRRLHAEAKRLGWTEEVVPTADWLKGVPPEKINAGVL